MWLGIIVGIAATIGVIVVFIAFVVLKNRKKYKNYGAYGGKPTISGGVAYENIGELGQALEHCSLDPDCTGFAYDPDAGNPIFYMYSDPLTQDVIDGNSRWLTYYKI